MTADPNYEMSRAFRGKTENETFKLTPAEKAQMLEDAKAIAADMSANDGGTTWLD